MSRRFSTTLQDQYFFQWAVAKGKYVIMPNLKSGYGFTSDKLQAIDQSGPWLICDWDKDKNNQPIFSPTFPIKDKPVLHRIFGSLDENNWAAVSTFALKYGHLGFQVSLQMPEGKTYKPVIGESILRWMLEIGKMKSLLKLWEPYKYMREDMPKSKVKQLRDKINFVLKQGVYQQFLPSYDWNPYLIPDCLLTAMYVMFLQEIIGETKPKFCPGCKSWFNPVRSDAKTCKPSCRKRMSRLGKAIDYE